MPDICPHCDVFYCEFFNECQKCGACSFCAERPCECPDEEETVTVETALTPDFLDALRLNPMPIEWPEDDEEF